MARERTHIHTGIASAVSGMVDRVVGFLRRRRTAVVTPNTDRALLERQKAAFARAAGILKDVDYPDWETPEKTSAWVRKLRAVDNQATEDKISPRSTP